MNNVQLYLLVHVLQQIAYFNFSYKPAHLQPANADLFLAVACRCSFTVRKKKFHRQLLSIQAFS